VPGAGGGLPSIVNDVEGPDCSESKGRLAATATLCTPGSVASPAWTRSANWFHRGVVFIFLARKGDIEHHKVIWPEARIHVGQALKAADQEPSPDQQHGAKGELREYENGSSAPTTRGAATSARAEHACDVPAGDMQCGHETEG